MDKKNKKADIAITILVLGVLALLIFGLLSFYLSNQKTIESGPLSFFVLRGVYNTADSFQFSGGNPDKYGIDVEEQQFVISHTVSGKQGAVLGIGGDLVEVLRIKYKFTG